MALTLQERFKLAKGMTVTEIYDNSVTVTLVEKIDAQLKKIAGELTQGTLLSSELPSYSTHLPTEAQIIEWCNRVQDNNGMANRMVSSIISYAAWDTDGAEITDAAIRTTCLNCVASYAKRI